MDAGKVEMLVILGANPVYTAPADLQFAERAPARRPCGVHLGLYHDETAEFSHWHVPEAHYLESWGDARAFDGTVTLMQPLIAPLYDGRTAVEVLADVHGQPERTGHDLVKGYWRRALAGETTPAWTLVGADGQRFADFETFWRTALNDGFVASTALPAVDARAGRVAGRRAVAPPPAAATGWTSSSGRSEPLRRPVREQRLAAGAAEAASAS